MNSRALLFLCVAFFCVCQQAPPIDFFKEDVTIEILDGQVRVTGVYFFENLTQIGKRIKFYYPFPVDSNHHYPDRISLSHPYDKDSAGVFFSLLLKPNSVHSFKITYEQQIEETFFRYITTTTKVWKRPIEDARFVIIAPDTLEINANYAFSARGRVDEDWLYCIEIQDFFPPEDLIITW